MDARKSCQKVDADLVSIGSFRELSKVTAMALEFQRSGVWIGLGYDKLSKSFRWSDGRTLNIIFWSPKLTRKNGPSDPLNCVYIDNDIDPSYWGASYCSVKRVFICKSRKPNLSSTVSPPLGCEKGMKAWSNKCYWLLDDPMTFAEAKSNCSKKGGHNLDIESTSEMFSVLSIISINEEGYWTGLHQNSASSSFEWSSGKPVYLNYRQLAIHKFVTTTNSCGYLKVTSNHHEMVLSNCTDHRPVICETLRKGFTTPMPIMTQVPILCPYVDWTPLMYSNKCIWKSGINQLTWQAAQSFCRMLKGDLLTITSEDQYNDVYESM
ncbi:Uncharacterised protein g6147 [Pycnogonum litorale]